MPTYKTPDVYVEEISVFPPSVAEVETAIPAFIGYTEIARKKTDDDLILKPTKIYSFKEYEQYYGAPEDDTIELVVVDDGQGGLKVSAFTEPTVQYLLAYSVKMFFDNGGGQCYIVSVGTYQDSPTIGLTGDSSTEPTSMYGLRDGLDAVKLEDEPTLIVIPEAVRLTSADYATLVQAVLLQCNTLGDRFGIFDLYGGAIELDAATLATNRDYFGTSYLKYGAAYYPFVKTAMNFRVNEGETNVQLTYGSGSAAGLDTFKTANTALYNFVKAALKEHFLTLPSSGAVAGIYAATDANRGVWKAPANISLAGVIEPAIKLDNARQDGLNVDATSGKSINAIRAFMGKGTLVWGARTLAGNDNEWRYVPVRRFFNMVEESIKKSTYWAVFEPNDANTWVKVRGMIENYLIQKWREGALAGATPKDAFFVRCGLGVTMTAQDILEGRMHVEIGMAAVRPAEFIILKFSHKMQTS
ncbi:phage tail sheath C-terminal domain-containing protein [Desulfobulbus sp.]|uniref:phage tail sheath family protein n=1 Tax=Desulfobulbus sp. TaxID=895 RepID=UPI00286F6362|nr:phage tail sheath C-terminal domain-containing protein [Desulfobulbus sp.]